MLRRLAGSPVFSVFAIVTLALGIGATTAIYAVADAVLFRPLAIADVSRVVNIYHHDPSRVTAGHQIALSWPDARDLAGRATTFSDVMFWSRFSAPVMGRGTFTPVVGELVSGNYFRFVGAQPIHGRPIQPSDDAAGAAPVVVVSEPFWIHTLGGDPAIVGQTLVLGHLRAEVVGVMPATFRGVDMPNVMPTVAWVPMAQAEALGAAREADSRFDREERWVLMKARLAPGRSIDEARTEVAAIGRSLDQAAPIGSAERRTRNRPEDVRAFAVTAASDLHMHESVDRFAVPTGQAVLAGVALVLLVACTNLANLLLARSAAARREVAVRRALGASRLDTVLSLAAESATLAAVGGLAGLLVSFGLISILSGRVAIGSGLALTIEPEITWRLAAVAGGATLAALLVFGLLPAWHTSRVSLRTLVDTGSAAATTRWRGRRWLIASQVGVSVALLVPGALFVRQSAQKLAHDPGFDLASLAAVQVNHQPIDRLADLPPADAEARNVVRADEMTAAVEAIRRLPGVASASLVSRLPIYFSTTVAAARISDAPIVARPDGRAPVTVDALRRVVYTTVGDAQTFETLGVPVVSGRPFDAAEVAAAAPVVVVSEAAARAVFNTLEVVGRTLYTGPDPLTIVGVARDTDWASIGRRRYASIYRPGRPAMDAPFVIAARAAGAPDLALTSMRRALAGVDPELPVQDAVTGPTILARQTLFDRVSAEVVGLLGGFALLLALTGLTGLLSVVVTSRRREIGVRMALGADRERVRRLVRRDGLKPVIYGGAAGLLGGAGLSSLLASTYYQLPGIDWTGIVIVGALLAGSALVASDIPARRAAALEPSQTLRDE